LHHFKKKANRLSAFGVRRSAFSVQRSAFSVQRSAFGVWRLAFGVWRLAFSGHHPQSPSVTSVASVRMLSCPTVSCTRAGAAPTNSLNFFWFLEIGVPIN
jgi:hypothetical protein